VEILGETRLDPATLELELNRNFDHGEHRVAVKVLEGIRKLGVSVAIDDFAPATRR